MADWRPVESVDLSYYLPTNVADYDPEISTPQAALGFQIGDRHMYHHELVDYFETLAEQSPRVQLEPYAHSHGGRPLFLVIVSSPRNLDRIDAILEQRKEWIYGINERRLPDPQTLPVVLNIGYGVHGNEPSATNTAPLIGYHLAAARDAATRELLDTTIILIDPCLNPDGLDRFAHHTNSNRGRQPNADTQNWDHIESFPTGRTNYYWFDLNRDWLPAVHPSSRGRLQAFHKWAPNVLLDFHEMGTDSTYFFQPGIQSRTHPLTPQKNQDITATLANYHAEALDEIGSLYFTEERFDDYYMGKGSTFPDLHGCIGILFEQASSRGQIQDSQNGLLTFPFTIKNQVTTSLSSLKATREERLQLLHYQREFFQESQSMAKAHPGAGWVFSTPHDLDRLIAFESLLAAHQIRTFTFSPGTNSAETSFPALFVPANQWQYRYIRALFDTPTEFRDSIFYDVSTWTLPLAFNLDWEPVKSAPADLSTAPLQRPSPFPLDEDQPLAYLIDYRNQQGVKTTFALLQAGIDIRVATSPFSLDNWPSLPAGTILIPTTLPQNQGKPIREILQAAQKEGHLPVTPLNTGLTPGGIDLGSRDFRRLNAPQVAQFIGPGVNQYRAGEIWHWMDQVIKQPLTLLDLSSARNFDFDRYTTLILPSANLSRITPRNKETLVAWVERGGILIAQGQSALELENWGLPAVTQTEKAKISTGEAVPYREAKRLVDLQAINGAILQGEVDTTHPLGYGFARTELPLFINSNQWWSPSDNPMAHPIRYSDSPLLSGYVSTENLEVAASSPAVQVIHHGQGSIIAIRDSPDFRGFWQGSRRLLANAILFGHLIDTPKLP